MDNIKLIEEIFIPNPKENKELIITAEELLRLDFGPELWTINELIPQHSITAITGAPESFKTWLTLEIAKCVANGSDFLGKFATQKGNILIVDKENHIRHIQERLKLLNFKNESVSYFLDTDNFSIDDEGKLMDIISIVRELNINLVIFDSLIRIHSGAENDARDISIVMNAFRRITKEGANVIFIHHNRKGDADKQSTANSIRGSSDIHAGIDCLLQINKLSEESIQITQSKLRQGKKIDPFKIQINSSDKSMEFVYVGKSNFSGKEIEEVKDIILLLLENKKEIPRQEILDELEDQYKKVVINTSLKELESVGKITKTVLAHNKHLFKLSIIPVEPELNIESEHNTVDPKIENEENKMYPWRIIK
jgi:KaiC/GvpD/RAD55 family RecA-like ATPase